MPSIDFASQYLDPDRDADPAAMRSALQSALDTAAQERRDLVIPRRHVNYRIDAPIDFRNAAGVRIVLDGTIENIRPGPEGVDKLLPQQSVFKLGNHHPVNWNRRGDTTPGKLAGLSFFRASSVLSGSNQLHTTYPTNWTVGQIVLIRSDACFQGARDHERPDFILLARIERLEPNLVVIDRPFDEDVEIPLVALAASDIALDLEGTPLFAADNVCIEGEGGIQTRGNLLARSATLECKVRLASSDAASAFYGNCFAASEFHFDRARVTRKIADISAGSHRSKFTAGVVTYEGTGGGVSALVIGENSRDNSIDIEQIDAADFAENAFVRITAARRNRIGIGSIHAPKVQGSAVMIGRAEDGDINRCTDNTIAIRDADFGSDLSQFVRSALPLGRASGNRVIKSGFRGRPTQCAALVEDAAMIGSDVTFEAGEVVVAGGELGGGRQAHVRPARNLDRPRKKRGLFGLW